jgi:methionine-rich copper-binding protein CopC
VTVLAAANATVSSSPFTSSFSAITSLSDNTAYDVYFIAEDDEGTPNLQSSVTKVDTTTLDATAPTLSSSSPSDNATGVAVGANIVLTFNENVQAGTGNIVISDGASDTRTIAIGDGQVSISGAVVTINPTANLSSSTTYYVQVASTAVEDTSGNAYAGISDTTTLNFTTVDTTAPTATFSPANGATDVAVDANITITFDEAVRLVNDSALTNSNVDALITLKETNSSGSNIAFDATISGNVITVNPSSDFSNSQQVYVAIGTTVEDTSDNAYAGGSATFTVIANTQTPATEFAENEAAIRAVLVDDMMRSVRSMLSVSRHMISDARNRLIAYDRGEEVLASTRSPLSIDGVARSDAVTASTRGTATSSLTRNGGAFRRLFFSDFDIQHNTDTDSTTATLSARVTWEHMASDSTMLGYFVGVEAAESDLNGIFAGDQTRLGVNAGGYVAHKLADQLYMDAYISLGVGHSELDMSNGTLALESDYRSETVTTGAALSGAYEYDAYEFRPELAFNYGKTELGQVFFTGRAYDLEDDTLSLNAGSVSIANVTLRPEVIYSIQNSPTANTNASLSFSPRLICERTMSTRRTQNCGGGGEVGYTAHSNDGLRNIDFRIIVDKVGNDSRSSAVFGVEMRF